MVKQQHQGRDIVEYEVWHGAWRELGVWKGPGVRLYATTTSDALILTYITTWHFNGVCIYIGRE